jgi:nicotinamidase/pyrazinamidase
MGVFTEKSGLLIADMIYDFVDPDGKLYVPGIEVIVPAIASLVAEARDAGIPVIYVNDSHDPEDEEFKLWGPHAIAGTPGTDVVSELAPASGDYVLDKTRYSAFYGTELDELLKKLGVEHLVITGTVTNICVMVSAIEALMRGYRVTVPSAAVHALSEADQDMALDQIERVFGGEVLR